MKAFDVLNKINFVDSNNTIVGWENTHNCCEGHDWWIEYEGKEYRDLDEINEVFFGFNFDLDSFIEKDLEFDETDPLFNENNCYGRLVSYLLIRNVRWQNKDGIFEDRHFEAALFFKRVSNGYYAHKLTVGKLNNISEILV